MKNNKNISELLSHWLEKFPPHEYYSIRDIWEESAQADEADKITITEEEKAASLAHIKEQIGQSSNKMGSKKSSPHKTTETSNWYWAAAAIFIISAGISYLFIPVQERAPLGEQKVVQLSDDTQITLNSGSSLSYNRLYGIFHRNTYLEGEAYFEVTSGEIPFSVETFNSSVNVLGTKFNVRSWSTEPSSETIVTLREGKVKFHSLEDPTNSVLLNAGQKSTLGSQSPKPTDPEITSVSNALSWVEQRFAFEDRPLWLIINELERRYDVTIQVQATRILSDSLTIYKSSQVDVEEILRDICINEGVSYRPINNGFVIEN